MHIYKLFTGKFSSDLSWLLVVSVLKQLEFYVRSIHNRIVYQISDDDGDHCSPNSEGRSNAVNFKLENGISVPVVVPFTPIRTPEEGTGSSMDGEELGSSFDVMGLRRSKRRYVQPERYMGCDDLSESDIDVVRMYKTYRWEYEEMPLAPLALSIQADHAHQLDDHSEFDKRVVSYAKDQYEFFFGSQKSLKSPEVESRVSNQREHPLLLTNEIQDPLQLAIVPVTDNTNQTVHEENPLRAAIPGKYSEVVGQAVSKYIYINGTHRVHRRSPSEGDIPESEGTRWGWKSLYKKTRRRRDRSKPSGRESFRDAGTTNCKRSFSASMYRELIRRCMDNIKSTINKEQPLVIDQWKDFQASKFMEQRDSSEVPSKNEEEDSEIEMLWKEMELCMQSNYLNEDSEV